jgi:preprotein translocase subunit SecF
MFIIRNKKIFLSIAAISAILSLITLFTWGLSFGIDFTGGSITEVSFNERPTQEELRTSLSGLELGNYSVQTVSEDSYLIRTRFLNEDEREQFNNEVESNLSGEIVRANSVGPSISKELTEKALLGISIVIFITILFIAFAFRNVSDAKEKNPSLVSSWSYGLIAIITLAHDILLPAGIFAVLGRFAGVEIDILFIMALLAILGISINDTIVVFDRIRENLKINRERHDIEEFSQTVGRSLSQTFVRSINTSVTTLLVLLSLFFLGSASVKFFILALIIGMVAGTYSSLFIASPLLVYMAERKAKKIN